MILPKITPGKWHVRRETTPGQFVTDTKIRASDDSLIAHITPCNIEVNAKAISALPQLLVALVDLTEAAQKQLDQSATHDGLSNCQMLANARQALEKAGCTF